jgi:uncharacterized membrane-anchored protein
MDLRENVRRSEGEANKSREKGLANIFVQNWRERT